MIENYRFGSINIDGKVYNYDVEVRWDGQVLEWRRDESHKIDIASVKRAIEQHPAIIIIGTGEMGVAEVSGETGQAIINQGIGLIVEKTGKAIISFNQKKEKGVKVIGLFHLTC